MRVRLLRVVLGDRRPRHGAEGTGRRDLDSSRVVGRGAWDGGVSAPRVVRVQWHGRDGAAHGPAWNPAPVPAVLGAPASPAGGLGRGGGGVGAAVGAPAGGVGVGWAGTDPGSAPPWSRRNGGYRSVITAT